MYAAKSSNDQMVNLLIQHYPSNIMIEDIYNALIREKRLDKLKEIQSLYHIAFTLSQLHIAIGSQNYDVINYVIERVNLTPLQLESLIRDISHFREEVQPYAEYAYSILTQRG